MKREREREKSGLTPGGFGLLLCLDRSRLKYKERERELLLARLIPDDLMECIEGDRENVKWNKLLRIFLWYILRI